MPFAYDTFSDTAGTLLQNHTSNSGHSWSRVVGTVNFEIQSNRVQTLTSPSKVRNVYVVSATPPSTNYYVQAVVGGADNSSSGDIVGVVARKQAGADTYYALQLVGGADGSRLLELAKYVSGTKTQLSTYSFNWLTNTNYTLKLVVDGNSLVGYLDGIQRVSATDSSITSAGQAGIVASNSTTSGNYRYFDDFEASLLPQTLTQSSGIQSGESFGNSIFQVIILQSSGIQSAEVFGLANLATLIQQISGIQSDETVNTPKLIIICNQSTGIPSAFASDIAQIKNLLQQLTGIQSAEIVNVSAIYQQFMQLLGNTGEFQIISAGNNTFIVIIGNNDSFYKL
jgi:hypothetical protein